MDAKRRGHRLMGSVSVILGLLVFGVLNIVLILVEKR